MLKKLFRSNTAGEKFLETPKDSKDVLKDSKRFRKHSKSRDLVRKIRVWVPNVNVDSTKIYKIL